ncbi:MAG: hypothetical protein H6730_28275 [Deltaproteobacteria bacterium]|nr:hypothetical protein [Deltaproteobacteria bacterium]
MKAGAGLLVGALALILVGCPQDVNPLPEGDAGAADSGQGSDAGQPPDAGEVPDAGARCGDGHTDPGEVCDGPDLGGATCAQVGAGNGNLACTSDCKHFDLSGCQACTPVCGARECGLEPVCNSSCGECGVDESCSADGQCLPSCALGSYRCTSDGFGYQACGPNDALGIQDLGPRVGCADGATCAENLAQPCERARCVPADVMVVMDRSSGTSLNATWSWMREALVAGMAGRDHEVRFGLREFPAAACEAGRTEALLRDAAQALGAQMTPPGQEGSVPLFKALSGLEGSFTPGQDAQAVLLITAGDETCDPADEVVRQAARLFRMGVRVYALGVTTRANQALLERVAQAGGTSHAYGATDSAGLSAALRAIFEDLGACANPTPMVAAGYYHACRLVNGVVACWGRDYDGRLSPPAGVYTHISAGTDNACGVLESGDLRCWGRNQNGQSIAPSGIFTQVAGGDSHFCGLKLDGTVACWGNDDAGQATPPAGTVFKQVAAAGFYSCGIQAADDQVACWGSGARLSGTFRQIDGGSFSMCGIATDGSLACAGLSDTPVVGTFLQVSAGADHACAVRDDLELVCWGLNHWGQSDAPAGPFVAVDVNNAYTCAARPDGEVECWGEGGNGQTTPPP